MDFETHKYIYTAFDGRIILRADIDRPVNSVGERFEYLSSLSDGCINFAAQKLKSRLTEIYENSYGSDKKYIPYSYLFRIKETYSDEAYSSILMISSIRRGRDNILGKCISVIFKDDVIIPSRLIARSRRTDSCIIITTDGSPVKVAYKRGEIVTERIEKHNFPI